MAKLLLRAAGDDRPLHIRAAWDEPGFIKACTRERPVAVAGTTSVAADTREQAERFLALFLENVAAFARARAA